MPAAAATSTVDVPYRPRGPTTFMAVRSTSSRRSSAVERVRTDAVAGLAISVSMHSLTQFVKPLPPESALLVAGSATGAVVPWVVAATVVLE